MIWYALAVSLHILAAVAWIGLATYQLLVVHPVAKRFDPYWQRREVRDLSFRIGWPCLGTTVLTGIFLLYYQGVTVQEFTSGRVFVGSFGEALRAKLALTMALIVLQTVVVARPAIFGWPVALVGLTIIGISTLLTR